MTRRAHIPADLERAHRHRPVYREGMALAARSLAAQGLRVGDIAQALGLGTAAAESLLTDSQYAYSAIPRPDAARGDKAAAIHLKAWASIDDDLACRAADLVRTGVPLRSIGTILGLTRRQVLTALHRAVLLTGGPDHG